MRLTGIALLLIACSLPACAQDSRLEKRKDWPTAFQTAHYEVRSTCTREQARKLADATTPDARTKAERALQQAETDLAAVKRHSLLETVQGAVKEAHAALHRGS